MIRAYLKDEATIIRSGGLDKNNSPLPPAEICIDCLFEFGTRKITGDKGEQVISVAKVMMAPEQEVTHDDKIRFDNQVYIILKITKPKAFSHGFTEVYVQ